jgi:hypothetical protein
VINGNGKELAVVEQSEAPVRRFIPSETYEPRSIQDALWLAKVLVQSRLLPRAVSTPEQAFTIILAGKELGLSAMQSLRAVHVIEGKPTLAADLQVALVKRSPTCRYFRMVKSDDKAAVYETQRDGDPEPTRLAFTIEEAQRAKLTGKDNWMKYPAAMLRARCASALARIVYPELVMGVYDPDELERPAPPRRALPRVQESEPEDAEPEPEPDTSDADAMIAECERGFVNWDAKRAWADDNKERKAALAAEVQERVSAAFRAAHPRARTKQPEPPPVESEPADEAPPATEQSEEAA